MNDANVEKIVNSLIDLANKDNVKDFMIANVVFQISFIEKLMTLGALNGQQEKEFVASIYTKLNKQIIDLLNNGAMPHEHTRCH